jgi:hypothetical protein
MAKPIACRYCGELFTGKPGKPGYFDECPACLHEKTIPKLSGRSSAPMTPEAIERLKEIVSAVRSLRRQLKKLGWSKEKIDHLIRSELTTVATAKSATHI